MHSPWLGEFLGTLVLILFGNGVCAAVTLRKSYAADAGWIVVTTGWALGVMCGVMVAQGFGSHDAALNPAITLAAAIVTGNYGNVLWLWSAQLLGAMCGASAEASRRSAATDAALPRSSSRSSPASCPSRS